MRYIVIAPHKRAAAPLIAEYGEQVVAVATPRSRGARGVAADAVLEAEGLTDEMRAMLRAEVSACLATTDAEPGSVRAALEKSLESVSHLTDADSGAVEALRALARKIDAWDRIAEWALDDMTQSGAKRPAVPSNDNVSISSFLKGCDQLGLSPAGRKSLELKSGGGSERKAKLTALQSAHRARTA